jgi:nicotinic acid mononucleotide adenylyltransferase
MALSPIYAEFAPYSAGIPVNEMIEKLECEGFLNRSDVLAINEALLDSNRREKCLKHLSDMEIGVNAKFAQRRLKALIHRNGGGEKFSRNSESSDIVKDLAGLGGEQPQKDHSQGSDLFTPRTMAHTQQRPERQISTKNARDDDISLEKTQLAETKESRSMTKRERSGKNLGKKQPSLTKDLSQMSLHPRDLAKEVEDEKLRTMIRDHSRGNFEKLHHSVSNRRLNPLPSVLGSGTKIQREESKSLLPTSGREPVIEGLPAHSTEDNSGSVGRVNVNRSAPARADLDEEAEAQLAQVRSALEKVFGSSPIYASPENFNICNKIEARLADFRRQFGCGPLKAPLKFAVLVGSGSMNPLTRMHMRTFVLAKKYLEQHVGLVVLGSFLSPAHGGTVRERYRTNASEIIPGPHRLAIAQLMVEDSRWLTVDPWEISRRRAMDYLSLLQHVQEILANRFDVEVKVVYVCKANMIPKLSADALRNEKFGVACVCRSPESDMLRNSLGRKWNGLLWTVEDTAILDASMDIVTSRKVRNKLKAGQAVEQLVGRKVQEYMNSLRLGAKMRGEEKWDTSERHLPTIASRPAEVIVAHPTPLSTSREPWGPPNPLPTRTNNGLIQSRRNTGSLAPPASRREYAKRAVEQ